METKKENLWFRESQAIEYCKEWGYKENSIEQEIAFGAWVCGYQSGKSTSTWQPITTAPKNGWSILVLLNDSDVPHSAYWDKDSGWRISWDQYKLTPDDGPTHWMPIPTSLETGAKWRVDWVCKSGARKGCLSQEWFLSKKEAREKYDKLGKAGYERSIWKENEA